MQPAAQSRKALSPCEEKLKRQNKTDRTVSVYIPVTERIASANMEPSVGVALRHVIPLMDLMLGEASVLHDGQRLHSPVVPRERKWRRQKERKKKKRMRR